MKLLLPLLLCLAAVTVLAQETAAPPPALFAPATAETAVRTAEQTPTTTRARAAILTTTTLGASLTLNLFDDVLVTAEQLSTEPAQGGGYLWHGHILDQPLSQVTLLVRDGQLWGNIRWPLAVYAVRPLDTNGLHLIEQINEWGFAEPPDDSVWDSSLVPPPNSRTPQENGSVIDVLVAYTPSVRQALGGEETAVQALLDLIVAETNTSYANSDIAQRIRLVHSVEVAYTEAGPSNSLTDLTRLANTSDGFLDEVHALRDTYGADVVHLMYESGDCGYGYIFAPFSISSRTCAATNLTFAHELGHNMGARHDWYVDAVAGNPNGYTGNHGYVYPPGQWRTVMAYNNLCSALGTSCTRLAYWSNPAKFYNAVPMGVWEGTSTACATSNTANPPCDADNRLTLNRTALTVSNWRTTQLMATAALEVDTTAAYPNQTLRYTITIRNDAAVTALNVVIHGRVPHLTNLVPGSLSGDASPSGTGGGSTITWNTGTNLLPGQSLTREYEVVAQTSGLVSNDVAVTSANSPLSHASRAVETQVVQIASCGLADGFETGNLSDFWAVETADSGRVRVLADVPYTGQSSVVLDDAVDDADFGTAALILTANLVGRTAADFDFAWRDLGDEYHADYDGVFVRSNPAASWVKVYDFSGSTTSYTESHLDLETYGQAFTDQYQIKLQFYDNFSFNPANIPVGDGYALDDIRLGCPLPQLTISQTASDPLPAPGQTLIYQIMVENNGTASATQAVISNTLPVGVSFVGPITVTGSSGVVATSAADLPTLASQLTIPAGQVVTVQFPVQVSPEALPGTVIGNIAAVTSLEVTTPRTAAVNVMVDGALLQPMLKPSDIIPEQGQLLDLILTLPNVGPDLATQVVVSGTLPPELTLVGSVVLVGTTGTTITDTTGLPLWAHEFEVVGLESVQVRVPVQLSPTATLGIPVPFTATVSYEQTAVPVTVSAVLTPSVKRYVYLPVIMR